MSEDIYKVFHLIENEAIKYLQQSGIDTNPEKEKELLDSARTLSKLMKLINFTFEKEMKNYKSWSRNE